MGGFKLHAADVICNIHLCIQLTGVAKPAMVKHCFAALGPYTYVGMVKVFTQTGYNHKGLRDD